MPDPHLDDIKRKIRKLKKLEMKIRFNSNCIPDGVNHTRLVWDEFFDLNQTKTAQAKYSFEKLAAMNKDEYRKAVDEFFFYVYYRFYQENGMFHASLYDPGILSSLGLPPDADETDVKKRFRELAKKYHPDGGGDSAKFVELMENYRSLTKK